MNCDCEGKSQGSAITGKKGDEGPRKSTRIVQFEGSSSLLVGLAPTVTVAKPWSDASKTVCKRQTCTALLPVAFYH